MTKHKQLRQTFTKRRILAIALVLAIGIILALILRDKPRINAGKFGSPLTISVNANLEATCLPGTDYGIKTLSSFDVDIENRSHSDITVTSVELVPEWITGSFWAGPIEESKNNLVLLDEWFHYLPSAVIAKSLYIDPKLHEALTKEGRIKEDADWYFNQENVFWVKPDAVPIKDIPAAIDTIESGDQKQFQMRLGLSRSVDFLYGTARLKITNDEGTDVESETFRFSVCKNVAQNNGLSTAGGDSAQ